MNNEYEVSGTRAQQGAIGVPDNFSVEIEAPNARDAYIQVLNQPGYERVHVVAIKIKCTQCACYHMAIDPNLYL